MLYILLLVVFGRGAEGHLIHTCLKKFSENQGAESEEKHQLVLIINLHSKVAHKIMTQVATQDRVVKTQQMEIRLV